jgi:Holliday junction resolvasome RuvABC endonuclease subunit
MVILGIDPGMTRLGYGSVTVEGNEIELGLSGMISHPRDTAALYNEYLNQGIAQIVEQFPVLLSIVQPTFIAAELVPAGRLGSRSELVVAAATAAKVIAFQWGIEWHDVAANTVKKTVAQDGNATKAKIRNAVMDAFPVLAERHKTAKEEQKQAGEKAVGIPQDVFDGIAIAIAGARIFGVINDNTNQGAPSNPS